MKLKKWQLPLTIILIVLGFFMSVQYKAQQDLANTLAMQKTEDLAAMIRNLHDKRALLEEDIDELLMKRRDYRDSVTAEKALAESMEAELVRLQIASGVIPVIGPGVTVTITGDSSLLYLDLIDIINELWATGAEAIAVNDMRILNSSSIYDSTHSGSLEIMINGEKVLYPIIVYAIGDPHTLEKGLTFPGGIVDNLNTLYHIYPKIRQEEEVLIPSSK